MSLSRKYFFISLSIMAIVIPIAAYYIYQNSQLQKDTNKKILEYDMSGVGFNNIIDLLDSSSFTSSISGVSYENKLNNIWESIHIRYSGKIWDTQNQYRYEKVIKRGYKDSLFRLIYFDEYTAFGTGSSLLIIYPGEISSDQKLQCLFIIKQYFFSTDSNKLSFNKKYISNIDSTVLCSFIKDSVYSYKQQIADIKISYEFFPNEVKHSFFKSIMIDSVKFEKYIPYVRE